MFKPNLNFLKFNKAVRARNYIEHLEDELVLPKNQDKHMRELMDDYNSLLRKSVILGVFSTLFGVLAYLGIIASNLETFGFAGLLPGFTRLLKFASTLVGGSVCLIIFLVLNWIRNIYINDSNIMAAHIISHVVVHGNLKNRNAKALTGAKTVKKG